MLRRNVGYVIASPGEGRQASGTSSMRATNGPTPAPDAGGWDPGGAEPESCAQAPPNLRADIEVACLDVPVRGDLAEKTGLPSSTAKLGPQDIFRHEAHSSAAGRVNHSAWRMLS